MRRTLPLLSGIAATMAFAEAGLLVPEEARDDLKALRERGHREEAEYIERLWREAERTRPIKEAAEAKRKRRAARNRHIAGFAP